MTAIIIPTLTPADDRPLRRPDPIAEPRLAALARRLDRLIGEAVQDFGLTLSVSERSEKAGVAHEEALLEMAAGAWVFSPRLSFTDHGARIRIVAASPGSRVLLVRSHEVGLDELDVRAVLLMRDLIHAGRGTAVAAETPVPVSGGAVALEARSRGRAGLALNAAALGGFVGFSLQRASGSADPRLTYPLIALGTGVGLGASMVVAEEWDVGVGEAWYLSAGSLWPTASALLLASGYGASESNRYILGLAGASAGLTLSVVALSFGGMSEGGAALTHSGGAFGTIFGGLAQLIYEGGTDASPTRGMGYGAGAGVLVAGAAATVLPPLSASRVLLVDLSASLGGLVGAAAASPLVFADRDASRDRAWLASIAAGLLAGGTVGFLLTAPSTPDDANGGSAHPALPPAVRPYAGIIAVTPDPVRPAPVLGAGLSGTW